MIPPEKRILLRLDALSGIQLSAGVMMGIVM